MRLRPALLSLLAVALMVSQGCGPIRRSSTVRSEATIEFINESIDQATVYARMPGGQQVRLGTALPGLTTDLRVPAEVISRGTGFSIFARLLARNDVPQTGTVVLRPGDLLQVRLPASGGALFVLPPAETSALAP
jgi:hypothetical protein